LSKLAPRSRRLLLYVALGFLVAFGIVFSSDRPTARLAGDTLLCLTGGLLLLFAGTARSERARVLGSIVLFTLCWSATWGTVGFLVDRVSEWGYSTIFAEAGVVYGGVAGWTYACVVQAIFGRVPQSVGARTLAGGTIAFLVGVVGGWRDLVTIGPSGGLQGAFILAVIGGATGAVSFGLRRRNEAFE